MLNFRVFLMCVLLHVRFKLGSCDHEPGCTSRFDYDYKMLQKMVQLEDKMRKLDELVKQQQQLLTEKLTKEGAMATYVRWGRNICPDHTQLIYKGYTAGKKYNDKGSGSNSLCLPSDPSWANYTEGVDEWRGRIYGTETDVPDIFAYPIHNQDMPCAVCKTQKSAVLMIPGRTKCYPTLTLEYSGYLMSGYHSHFGPHSYICLDSQPEIVPRGGDDDSQHILYPVESMCGSLPCPPYVNGRELACVVCSV